MKVAIIRSPGARIPAGLLAHRLFALMLCATLLHGCGQQDPQPGGDKPRAERPAHTVYTAQVSTRPLTLARTLSGNLEASRVVHIHTQQEGRIIDLPFYQGDRVAADTVIARLDDALLQAQLETAVANRRQAETNLRRLRDLAANRLVSEDDLARAETAAEIARADESLQRTRLSYTVIHAPFAGIISARLKEPGDAVPSNAHILTLYDPGRISITVAVPQEMITHLTPGNKARVRIDSLGQTDHTGTISRIHPMVDPATRHGTVEVTLDAVPAKAQPGLASRVVLEAQTSPRRIIPVLALRYDADGPHVFGIDDESKARRMAVRPGLQLGDAVEITDGLTDGDVVIVKGFLNLRQGTRVRVVNDTPGAGTPG